jgi:hypothetical protein
MLNSGLFRVKRAVHDPGLLEWYLRRAAPDILRHFAEQTAWAFLCGKARTRFWHPAQIRLAHPSTGVTAGTVALHYVGPYRDRLTAPADEAGDGGPEVSLRSVPAPSIGGLGALTGEANRVLRRLRGLGPYADEPYRGLLEIGDGEN